MGKDDKLIKIASYNTELIYNPDFVGMHDGNMELIKCFKDNIFISIKLDVKKSKYYVATVFDVKQSKIDSYVRSGRLIKIDEKRNI